MVVNKKYNHFLDNCIITLSFQRNYDSEKSVKINTLNKINNLKINIHFNKKECKN